MLKSGADYSIDAANRMASMSGLARIFENCVFTNLSCRLYPPTMNDRHDFSGTLMQGHNSKLIYEVVMKSEYQRRNRHHREV